MPAPLPPLFTDVFSEVRVCVSALFRKRPIWRQFHNFLRMILLFMDNHQYESRRESSRLLFLFFSAESSFFPR